MGKPVPMNKGDVFGHFVLTGESKWVKEKKERHVECICVCGKIVWRHVNQLKKGEASSCGCKTSEKMIKSRTTHGLSGSRANGGKKHPLYSRWDAIKQRCTNHNSANFHRYGGRGIMLFPEWCEFEKFKDWCISNGWMEDLEIDRYPNNDGNYEPGNIRFATHIQNSNNTSATTFLVAFGERKSLGDWSRDERCVVKKCTLKERIKTWGWDPEKAITEPSQRKKNAKHK